MPNGMVERRRQGAAEETGKVCIDAHLPHFLIPISLHLQPTRGSALGYVSQSAQSLANDLLALGRHSAVLASLGEGAAEEGAPLERLGNLVPPDFHEGRRNVQEPGALQL